MNVKDNMELEMKTMKLFIMAIIIVISFPGNIFAQWYDIQQLNSNGSVEPNEWIGQSFTTGASGGITKIWIDFNFSGTGTLGVILEIYEGEFQTLIYKSALIGIYGSGWQSITLSSPVYVSAGSVYSFKIKSERYSTGRYFRIDYSASYPDGQAWYPFGPKYNEDMKFLVRINEQQPPSEIEVKQGSTSIGDGGSYDFGAIKIGADRDKIFTIYNSGSGKLKLTTPFSFEAGSDPEFSIISQPDAEVEPGATTTFTVRFHLTAADAKTASISFENNDGNENPYDITFNGSGGYPEINLKQDATNIANGGSYDYGDVNAGSNSDVIFTIENTGTALLILTTPLTLGGANADQFSITVQPDSEINLSSSSTFTVRFSPTTQGSKTATIDITNNDSDEDTYNLTLIGVDVEINLKQSTTNIADGGTYNYSDTDIGNNTDVIFTIENTGSASYDLSITTPLTLSGTNKDQFSVTVEPASAVAAGNSTTFTVRFSPTSEGSKSTSIAIENNDANENPYDLNLTGTGIGYPEMGIDRNGVTIADGDETPSTANGTDFGIVPLSGGNIEYTFILRNTGNGTLNINGNPRVSVSGDHALDFTVTLFPAATVAPYNTSTTFRIAFDPSANTVRNGEISIDNDDADENPYNFSVTGIGDNETNPNVTTYSPEDNGEAMLRQYLSLDFNEDVTAVSGKNITINDPNEAVFEQIPADDARVTVSGSQVTIKPNGTLVEGTEYNVQIDAGAFKDIVDDNYAGIQNSTTWNFTAFRAEDPGYALDFDGSDDRIPVSFTLPDDGTIEFWIKTDNLSSTTKCLLYSSATFPWYIKLNSTDISVQISNSGIINSSVGITANQWHHIALSWDRNTTLVSYNLFINGNASGVEFNHNWKDPGSAFTIGAEHSTGNLPFDGIIDEFRVWNVVRTPAEIQAYMHKGLTGNESGLQIFYPLDETNGTGIFDYSGNTNDATALGVDNNSWIASGAPYGEDGLPVRTTLQTPIGAAGKQMVAQITGSEPLALNYLGIYASGDGDSPVTNDDFGSSGATKRSDIIWGVQEFGSVTATLTFNYSNIPGIGTEAELKLLKRNDPSSAWTDVTASATQNTGNHTFTMTGVTEFSHFSVGGGGENPLPVGLTSFTVQSCINGVILRWITESEIENLGFLIERRLVSDDNNIDNDNWQEIASYKNDDSLLGQGSTSSATEYTYVDQFVEANTTYEYRLADIDYSGIVTYHATRKITVKQTPLPLLIKEFTVLPAYPNPFNPSITIRYGIPGLVMQGNVSVQIYDISGKLITTLVNKEQLPGWHTVIWNGVKQNGEQVSTGLYFSRIVFGNKVKTSKLMLLR